MPWLLTLYPGMIILPLAALSLLSRFRKRVLIWLVVFIISIALALGENAPLYRFFYQVFPAFRFPEKFVFPANFSLLLMAAYGFEGLLSRLEKRRRSANLLFLGLFVFLVLDLFWAHRNLNPVANPLSIRLTTLTSKRFSMIRLISGSILILPGLLLEE